MDMTQRKTDCMGVSRRCCLRSRSVRCMSTCWLCTVT